MILKFWFSQNLSKQTTISFIGLGNMGEEESLKKKCKV